jgi:acetyltransferase-like isoleucine patch superfamily enzyme
MEYERDSNAALTAIPNIDSTVNFGSAIWGETPSTYSITLIEEGYDHFVIYSVDITGTHADDFSLIEPKANTFPSTVTPNTSYEFQIECHPSSAGLREATFTLTTNIPSSSTIEYPLQCTGLVASYQATLTEGTTIDFGDSDVNIPTANQSFDITNASSEVDLDLSATITGTDASDFQIVTEPSSPLSTGNTTTIELNCTPSAGGLREATLELTTNDPENQKVSYPLQCTGKAPLYESKPSPNSTVVFGTGLPNTILTTDLKISNNGNKDLIINASSIEGADASVFTLSVSLPITIPAGDNQPVTITCIPPAAPTNYSGTLHLTADDYSQTVSYPLSCTGTDVTEPLYDSTPTPGETINLGSSIVDTTVSNTFTIQEVGNDTLEVTKWEIIGEHADDFHITTGFPITINNGEPDEIVTIECTPSAAGTRTATLNLTTNASNVPNPTYPLECNGLVAGYRSNPVDTLMIGGTPLGQPITDLIEIKENGDADLTIDLASESITGTHAEEFSITYPNLSSFPLSIVNDSSNKQWIQIQCTPTGLGARMAQLNLTSNDPNNPTPTYDLICTGKEAIGPGYGSTPILPGETIEFGSVPLGRTVTETFDIQEIGTAVLDVDLDTVAISGPHKKDFHIDSSIFPFYISNKGLDVSVTVTCEPTAEGPRTATLQLTTSDPLNPKPTYTLECTGTPPLIPGYSSTPAPNSTLDLGSSYVDKRTTQTIEIQETGNVELTVALAETAITGTYADDFSLLSPDFPLSISDGGQTQHIKVQCQPSTLGTRTATLNLVSNDPSNQTPTYQLKCTGTSPTPQTPTISLPSKLTFTVKMAGQGTGIVKSVRKDNELGGYVCTSADGECQYTFDSASTIKLTVDADKGSYFKNDWGIDEDCADGEVFLNQSKTCTAYFKLLPKTLIIGQTEQGTISSTPSGILCGSGGNQCSHPFEGGTKVNLTITPNKGWEFDSWKGCHVENGQVTMTDYLSCIPQFVPQPATPDDLEIIAQDCKIGGKIDFGTQPVGTSTSETITITNTGHTALPLNDLSLPPGLSLVDNFPESIAALETLTFQVQLDATEVGTYDGMLSFKSENETVFSCPIEGTVIAKATIPEETSTITQTTETDETEPAESIVPEETPINYTLNMTKTGTGHGTVNSEQSGISCGLSCLADYLSGTEVKLTARAEAGSTFISWHGDCSGSDNDITVLITKSFNCEAQFDQIIPEAEPEEEVDISLDDEEPEELDTPIDEVDEVETPISYTLNVTQLGTGNGTIISQITGIQCGTDCSFDYLNETKVILTAIADDDSRFIGWDEACDGTDRQFTLTMDEHQNCTAIFDKMPEETTIAPLNEEPCPLVEYINEICNLGGETARYAIIGSEANISNVVLEGTTTNLGWVSNALLTEGSSLRGGIITGYFTNQGLLADFDFRGAVLEGGMLSGIITNRSPIKGIIKNVDLAANTTISEGRVGGYLIGDDDAPARFDNLRITNGTYLENIIIGNNVEILGDVTYGPGVRFLDEPERFSEEHFDKVVQADGEILRNTRIGPDGRLFDVVLAGTIHNQGQISGATLLENGYLSGGILKKQILNQGIIANVKLKGHLMGGILAGTIDSSKKAIIQNVELAPNTKLKGGTLQDEVTGNPDFPAYLESLTLAPNSRVSNVIIGPNVVNDGHCTINHFEFRGTTLTGCQLGGRILNTMGGTLTDVKFAPNAHLIGGNLTGNIVGDAQSPALLENVTIPAGSYLENVIIGDNVDRSKNVTIGPGVTYLNEPSESTESEVVETALLIHPNGDVQVEPNTHFMSGIMDRDGSMYLNQAMLTYSQAEFVTLATQISVLPEHIGQTADLLMVALYEDKDRKANYMRVGQEWLPWDNQISSLGASETQAALPDSLSLWVYQNDLTNIAPKVTFLSNGHLLSLEDVAGEYQFYVGYRVADGTLVFNGLAPIHLFVERSPTSCILSAVHDKRVNDSQIITIDLSAGLKGDMKPLGPLYEGHDIEGLALHPFYERLYGSAGNHAEVPGLENQGKGHVYTIHRETGELTWIGATGFEKVSGLAFNPVDYQLWGWARNEEHSQWTGLITIDIDTGIGTPVKQFDYSQHDMGGLTWNYEGTKLYASGESTLWVYEPEKQSLEIACEQAVDGKIEGLDMQPNGFLLMGVDKKGQNNEETSIIAYDPTDGRCEVVHKRVYEGLKYDDLESIVWPSKQCNDLSWLSDKSKP